MVIKESAITCEKIDRVVFDNNKISQLQNQIAGHYYDVRNILEKISDWDKKEEYAQQLEEVNGRVKPLNGNRDNDAVLTELNKIDNEICEILRVLQSRFKLIRIYYDPKRFVREIDLNEIESGLIDVLNEKHEVVGKADFKNGKMNGLYLENDNGIEFIRHMVDDIPSKVEVRYENKLRNMKLYFIADTKIRDTDDKPIFECIIEELYYDSGKLKKITRTLMNGRYHEYAKFDEDGNLEKIRYGIWDDHDEKYVHHTIVYNSNHYIKYYLKDNYYLAEWWCENGRNSICYIGDYETKLERVGIRYYRKCTQENDAQNNYRGIGFDHYRYCIYDKEIDRNMPKITREKKNHCVQTKRLFPRLEDPRTKIDIVLDELKESGSEFIRTKSLFAPYSKELISSDRSTVLGSVYYLGVIKNDEVFPLFSLLYDKPVIMDTEGETSKVVDGDEMFTSVNIDAETVRKLFREYKSLTSLNCRDISPNHSNKPFGPDHRDSRYRYRPYNKPTSDASNNEVNTDVNQRPDILQSSHEQIDGEIDEMDTDANQRPDILQSSHEQIDGEIDKVNTDANQRPDILQSSHEQIDGEIDEVNTDANQRPDILQSSHEQIDGEIDEASNL